MLDLKEEIKDFKPVDLSGLSSEETLYTESMRIAFTLYNKALKEIQDGYRDLAKNNLRKAVTHYPEFGDAMLVLAICTFVNGDRIGAVRLFNAVKKPEDRKRGMEILDHLASAPDYIPPRTPAAETRTVTTPYERPVFGKYGDSSSSSFSSHTVRTEYIPKEIRPASQSRLSGEDVPQRARGVRSQYTGTRRQELMRTEQPVEKLGERPEPAGQMVPEAEPKEQEHMDSSLSGSIFGRNRVLTIIFVVLAAFAILAAAAWMSASAQNRKLQAELAAKPSVSASVSRAPSPIP